VKLANGATRRTAVSYSIGELAKLTGVSIRALRHYDDVGLLSPRERTAAGYRKYGETEMKRLRQIVAYRALGFDLATIAKLLSDSPADAEQHLRDRKRAILDQVRHLESLVREIDSMGVRPGSTETSCEAPGREVPALSAPPTVTSHGTRHRAWDRTVRWGRAAASVLGAIVLPEVFILAKVNNAS
jgi:DNA-binding transcriptional MerR regulator